MSCTQLVRQGLVCFRTTVRSHFSAGASLTFAGAVADFSLSDTRRIDTYVQDACAFYEDLAVYPAFGGVVLSGGEGAKIAQHLGSCKAVLMQNHGQLTVGDTIDSAVGTSIRLFPDRFRSTTSS